MGPGTQAYVTLSFMNTITRCKPLLGTYVEMTVSGNQSRSDLIDLSSIAFSEIENVQNLMSFHDQESQLSYINKHAFDHSCDLSPELEEVLRQAVQISEMTQGVFDISVASELVKNGKLPNHGISVDETADWSDIKISQGQVKFEKPMLLDLGGIAKGYAVDKAISALDDTVEAVINAGGDMRMTHWQGQSISIRNDALGNHCNLEMSAPAVASSADYFLNGESVIISPDLRQPVQDPTTYSVFASNCMLADALTKIAFLSEDRVDIIRSYDAQLVSVDQTGNITIH